MDRDRFPYAQDYFLERDFRPGIMAEPLGPTPCRRSEALWLASLYTESDYSPTTGELLHIETMCGFVAKFHMLLASSPMSHPNVFGIYIGQDVAYQLTGNLIGSAVTENSGIVPLLRILDNFGDRHKIRPVVLASVKPDIVP